MTQERRNLHLAEQRIRLWRYQKGRCATCGQIHTSPESMELAHKVAETKANIKAWGFDAIDDDENKAMVCREKRAGFDCNSAQNIGNKPASSRHLMERIREKQGAEETAVLW